MFRTKLLSVLIAIASLTFAFPAHAQTGDRPPNLQVPPKIDPVTDVVVRLRSAHEACDVQGKRNELRGLQGAMASVSRIMLREQALIVRAIAHLRDAGGSISGIGNAGTLQAARVAVLRQLAESRDDGVRDKLVELGGRIQRYEALEGFYHRLVGTIYEIETSPANCQQQTVPIRKSKGCARFGAEGFPPCGIGAPVGRVVLNHWIGVHLNTKQADAGRGGSK